LRAEPWGEFWRWAYSDLRSNANRGRFAEYLVGRALGGAADDRPRVEWAAADLEYREFWIEVKASGYWQSWPQRGPSAIQFGIAKTKLWDEATGLWGSAAPARWADLYVFCHHAERRRASADPLVVGQWDFYVVPTERIDAACGDGKSVGVERVRRLAADAGLRCEWAELKAGVDQLLAGRTPRRTN
jgi:hypothetical protein